MLVRIEANSIASGMDFPNTASAPQLAVARTLQSSKGVGQNVVDGEEVTVTSTMSITYSSELGGLNGYVGYVRFRIADVCYNVGGTLNCHGEGASQAGAASGNLTDAWISNDVAISLP
jgi:hypothetical protein